MYDADSGEWKLMGQVLKTESDETGDGKGTGLSAAAGAGRGGIVGAPGMVNGVKFDWVLNITAEYGGHARPLQLGYNFEENAALAASNFVSKHFRGTDEIRDA